jgi:arabinofuranosyltransferase
MGKRASDIVWLSALALATGAFAFGCFNFALPPDEDAAMLMRYAQHLAQGHGIVWNIGEPPVDGATDFLFMVTAAAGHRAGVPLESAVHLLTVASHFVTVALIYLALRHVQGAGVFAAVASALYVAVGPGLPLAVAYFGTPFFVLWVTVAWILGQRIVLGEKRAALDCVAFSLAGLVAGLTRPEGVFIAAFMAGGLCLLLPYRDARRLALLFACVFGLLGGVYFAWRWHYFGYPLPNPFYKKGGGWLYPRSVVRSALNVCVLSFPFLVAFPFALRTRRALLLALGFSIPIVGSTVMWLLMSTDMNFGCRFQYPVLCLAALSWFPLVRSLREDLRLPRLRDLPPQARTAIVVATLVVVAGILALRIKLSRQITSPRVGTSNVAQILRDYAARGYTLATTEAGILPLYSEWRAIDTWGLNNAWVAHHGPITEAYLRREHPAIVMWHEYFSPMAPPSVQRSDPWFQMVLTLKRYVEGDGYRLAAAFGRSPFETHYYYVRTDIPESAEIIERIRSTPYPWYEGNEPAVDFAALSR